MRGQRDTAAAGCNGRININTHSIACIRIRAALGRKGEIAGAGNIDTDAPDYGQIADFKRNIAGVLGNPVDDQGVGFMQINDPGASVGQGQTGHLNLQPVQSSDPAVSRHVQGRIGRLDILAAAVACIGNAPGRGSDRQSTAVGGPETAQIDITAGLDLDGLIAAVHHRAVSHVQLSAYSKGNAGIVKTLVTCGSGIGEIVQAVYGICNLI